MLNLVAEIRNQTKQDGRSPQCSASCYDSLIVQYQDEKAVEKEAFVDMFVVSM